MSEDAKHGVVSRVLEKGGTIVYPSPPGDITFSVAGDSGHGHRVILVLKASGDIFVHGRLAASDLEIVDGMREFIAAGRVLT